MSMQRHSCFAHWVVFSSLVAAVALSIGRAIAEDCNHNGIPDQQDYATGVLHDVNPADGIPDECEGCPAGRLYTTTADFQLGTLTDSIDTSVSGELRLKAPLPMRPYVNIACSARGTVARINVDETDPAKAVVGEYATAPLKLDITGLRYGLMNPSRTTVDHKGNIWVANRDEDSPSPPGSGVGGIGNDRHEKISGQTGLALSLAGELRPAAAKEPIGTGNGSSVLSDTIKAQVLIGQSVSGIIL